MKPETVSAFFIGMHVGVLIANLLVHIGMYFDVNCGVGQ